MSRESIDWPIVKIESIARPKIIAVLVVPNVI